MVFAALLGKPYLYIFIPIGVYANAKFPVKLNTEIYLPHQ